MLPLEIQMQIDLSAQWHSREIAEGFAKARAKLPPDRPDVGSRLYQMLFNAAQDPWSQYKMMDLRPGAIVQVEPWQYQNAAWNGMNGLYTRVNSSFWG